MGDGLKIAASEFQNVEDLQILKHGSILCYMCVVMILHWCKISYFFLEFIYLLILDNSYGLY